MTRSLVPRTSLSQAFIPTAILRREATIFSKIAEPSNNEAPPLGLLPQRHQDAHNSEKVERLPLTSVRGICIKRRLSSRKKSAFLNVCPWNMHQEASIPQKEERHLRVVPKGRQVELQVNLLSSSSGLPQTVQPNAIVTELLQECLRRSDTIRTRLKRQF
jgi:hypothetical protein